MNRESSVKVGFVLFTGGFFSRQEASPAAGLELRRTVSVMQANAPFGHCQWLGQGYLSPKENMMREFAFRRAAAGLSRMYFSTTRTI